MLSLRSEDVVVDAELRRLHRRGGYIPLAVRNWWRSDFALVISGYGQMQKVMRNIAVIRGPSACQK